MSLETDTNVLPNPPVNSGDSASHSASGCVPASASDKGTGQHFRQVLQTEGLPGNLTGKIKYRVRFAPNSNPDNIQRDVILAASEDEARNIYALSGCMVLDCVDLEWEAELAKAQEIVNDCADDFMNLQIGLNRIAGNVLFYRDTLDGDFHGGRFNEPEWLPVDEQVKIVYGESLLENVEDALLRQRADLLTALKDDPLTPEQANEIFVQLAEIDVELQIHPSTSLQDRLEHGWKHIGGIEF